MCVCVPAVQDAAARGLKSIWDQIQSTLKSVQQVMATKEREEKVTRNALELRIDGLQRVLSILLKEKQVAAASFEKSSRAPSVPGDTAASEMFWAKIGELDHAIDKVPCRRVCGVCCCRRGDECGVAPGGRGCRRTHPSTRRSRTCTSRRTAASSTDSVCTPLHGVAAPLLWAG